MKGFILGFILLWIWVGFEIWRAPLLEQTDDGKFIIKRKERKLSDLFNKKKK